MTDPSSPNYQITLKTPDSDVVPDHHFEPLVLPNYCGHTMLTLPSGWPVLCGLARDRHSHPTHHPPDEARDL